MGGLKVHNCNHDKKTMVAIKKEDKKNMNFLTKILVAAVSLSVCVITGYAITEKNK